VKRRGPDDVIAPVFKRENVLSLFLRRLFRRFLLLCSRPVVQVVGDIVAFAAFRELPHHSGRMGRAMAVLAIGDHLVFFLMAEGTGQGRVFCLAGCQEAECLAVAGAAILRSYVGGIGYILRHVCLVALLAIGRSHFRRVRFVALRALRLFPVDAVTEGAGKGAVLALVVFQLGYLICMTGDAGIRYVAFKRNLQGRMRILVAAEAALKFKMGLPHVAFTALGYGFFDFRRMAHMTAGTPHVLVFSAGRSKVSRGSIVAL